MKLKEKLRGPYNYDSDKASDDAALDCSVAGPSMTQQHQAEEADINTIVRRFGLTGQLPQSLVLPTFADFEDVFDFQTAQNALVAAERSFMQVPADIRGRFENSPQKFVEFCSDPKNLPELRRMGLAPEPAPVDRPTPADALAAAKAAANASSPREEGDQGGDPAGRDPPSR